MKWNLKDGITYLIACLILFIFGVFVVYLVGMAGPKIEQVHWVRLTYLFSGVEAIAFAAAGFLFGKEVHRRQAENAEARASDAQHKATAALANGRVLANKIREHAKPISSNQPMANAQSQIDEKTKLDSLIETANALFPPLES